MENFHSVQLGFRVNHMADSFLKKMASDVYYLLEKPIRSYALQFAIRAIVTKYIRFAKRILADASFAHSVDRILAYDFG
jgi:hypothetical protein